MILPEKLAWHGIWLLYPPYRCGLAQACVDRNILVWTGHVLLPWEIFASNLQEVGILFMVKR